MPTHSHVCYRRNSSVYSWETAATTLSLCDTFGWWPCPRLSYRERRFCWQQGESPALCPVGEQGDALAQSIIWNQSEVPALCSTLGLLPHSQRILLPEYPTPAARVQRYMEFAGRNTTKWNHCIWKCVFSCPKSSVHKQNCKCYMYKP